VKVRRIGIIAEDDSDIEVLKHFLSKLTSRRVSVAQFTGKGCGAIKRKTPGWCAAFVQKGCSAIVLVHDRDKHKESKLRSELELVLASCGMQDIASVVIPCEELEAWLLSDTQALKVALKLTNIPKNIPHPEDINSPKEFIGKLVRQHSKSKGMRYVNTIHNLHIASALNVASISGKCPSFKRFEKFVARATN
jgi:hypothetical protein